MICFVSLCTVLLKPHRSALSMVPFDAMSDAASVLSVLQHAAPQAQGQSEKAVVPREVQANDLDFFHIREDYTWTDAELDEHAKREMVCGRYEEKETWQRCLPGLLMARS